MKIDNFVSWLYREASKHRDSEDAGNAVISKYSGIDGMIYGYTDSVRAEDIGNTEYSVLLKDTAKYSSEIKKYISKNRKECADMIPQHNSSIASSVKNIIDRI